MQAWGSAWYQVGDVQSSECIRSGQCPSHVPLCTCTTCCFRTCCYSSCCCHVTYELLHLLFAMLFLPLQLLPSWLAPAAPAAAGHSRRFCP